MKTRNNIFKNNRGAAMVSIMIAVAFISILASALLYMAYSNFQMKVGNYEAKVNFYGTEREMTVLTTAIRNEVAEAGSNPLDVLKTAVGCYEVTPNSGVFRYNPQALAKLVHEDITMASGTGHALMETTHIYINSVDNTKAIYSYAGSSSTAGNFVITDSSTDSSIPVGEKVVTLKDVRIVYTEVELGTENAITTDLVFRVKETPVLTSPGGIGEFSVLMDSPVATSSTDAPTRITMYGNTFVGPGTYVYDASGVINPAGENALVLEGSANFTQKGDYMIVFGNIVLRDKAVLNIAGGRLTVCGNIIVEDDAAFLCTGEVYFPDLTNDGSNPAFAGTPYGIKVTTGNDKNILPASLLGTSGCQKLDSTNYTNLITTLGLDDANDADGDDGILEQIIEDDLLNRLRHCCDSRESSPSSMFGIGYRTEIYNHGTMNIGDVDGSLTFFTNSTGVSLPDGANLNATMIGVTSIKFGNEKNIMLTQMGSTVFDNYIDESDTSINKVTLRANGYADTAFHPGEFFVSNANGIVNNMISYGTNNSSSMPTIETAVGYANWTKE